MDGGEAAVTIGQSPSRCGRCNTLEGKNRAVPSMNDRFLPSIPSIRRMKLKFGSRNALFIASVFGTNTDAHVLAGYIAKERVTPDDPNLWNPDPADYLKPDPLDYLKPDPEGYLSPDPQNYLAPDAPTTVSAASLPLLLRTSWDEIVKRLGCPPWEKVVKALAASGRTAESEVTAPCWEAALMRLGTVHKKQAPSHEQAARLSVL